MDKLSESKVSNFDPIRNLAIKLTGSTTGYGIVDLNSDKENYVVNRNSKTLEIETQREWGMRDWYASGAVSHIHTAPSIPQNLSNSVFSFTVENRLNKPFDIRIQIMGRLGFESTYPINSPEIQSCQTHLSLCRDDGVKLREDGWSLLIDEHKTMSVNYYHDSTQDFVGHFCISKYTGSINVNVGYYFSVNTMDFHYYY